MAVTYGFYNSLNKDRVYNAEQMSSIFNGIIRDGVFPSIGNSLMTIAGSGLGVIVKPGRAWFNGTWTDNDAELPLTVSAADIALTRIDAVILEVNSASSARENSIKILKGTVSANPSNPTLTNTATLKQYALAYITIKPNATTITASDITINVGKTGCPYVTSVLQQTDITDLFNQWEDEFETWFADVQSQLSGDVAANLLNKINQKVDISDKATSDEVTAGTDDSKWVTPKGCNALRKTAINHSFLVGDVKLSQAKLNAGIWHECNGSYVDANSTPLNALNGITSGTSADVKYNNISTASYAQACVCTDERIVTIQGSSASIYNIETGAIRTIAVDSEYYLSSRMTQIRVINNLWMFAAIAQESSSGSTDYICLYYSSNLGESWTRVVLDSLNSSRYTEVYDIQWDEENSRYLVHACRNESPTTYYGTLNQSPWSRASNGFALWNTGRSAYIKFISGRNSNNCHALYAYTTTNIDDDGSAILSSAKHLIDESTVSSDRYGTYTVQDVHVGYTTINSICFMVRFTHNTSSSSSASSKILMNHNWYKIVDLTGYDTRMSGISAKGSILLAKDNVCEMIVGYGGGTESSITKIQIPGLIKIDDSVFDYATNSWLEIVDGGSTISARYITAPEGMNNKVVGIPSISAESNAKYYIKIAEEE